MQSVAGSRVQVRPAKAMTPSVRAAQARRLRARRRESIILITMLIGSQLLVIAYGWWFAHALGITGA